MTGPGLPVRLGPAVLGRTTERVPGRHDLLMVGPPGGGRLPEPTHDPENPLNACRRPAAPGSRRTTRTGRSTA